MRLRKALGILLMTAIGVGILSWTGGSLLMHSEMCKVYADYCDNMAEELYELGAHDDAREMRNSATEMRDAARESHEYGIYCIVGALFVVIGGAGWMAWRFEKENPPKESVNCYSIFRRGDFCYCSLKFVFS